MADNTDWWFAAAQQAFGFLVDDCGFRIAERYRHFKGNSIRFERPDMTVGLECPPDWNDLSGWVWLVDTNGLATEHDIVDLLDGTDPDKPSRYAADSGPLDRSAVASKMNEWAASLESWLAKNRPLPGDIAER